MTAPASSRPSQRGAFVVESLVAAAVFSIGLLATVAFQAQSNLRIEDARCRNEASNLAQSLLARMWTEDPASLAGQYGGAADSDGFAAFSRLVARLPGAQNAGNAPTIVITPGPSASSRTVAVTVRWQLPGTGDAHRYTTTAVIGRN